MFYICDSPLRIDDLLDTLSIIVKVRKVVECQNTCSDKSLLYINDQFTSVMSVMLGHKKADVTLVAKIRDGDQCENYTEETETRKISGCEASLLLNVST